MNAAANAGGLRSNKNRYPTHLSSFKPTFDQKNQLLERYQYRIKPASNNRNNGFSNAFQQQKMYKFSNNKHSDMYYEVESNYHYNFRFKSTPLKNANNSVYGNVYELEHIPTRDRKHTVMKQMKLRNKSDIKVFRNEVYVGSRSNIEKYGTKIHCFAIYNPSTREFLSIDEALSTKRNAVNTNLIGVYLMDHVLKGMGKGAITMSLGKFTKNYLRNPLILKRFPNLYKETVAKLSETFKRFYSVPKAHGDYHDENIMVVLNKVGGKLTVAKVVIIDYGSVFIIPKPFSQAFSKKNTLASTFHKLRLFMDMHKNPFMRKTSQIHPKNSDPPIHMYEVFTGGQRIRHNKNVIRYYEKNLIDNVIRYNKKKRDAETPKYTLSYRTLRKNPSYTNENPKTKYTLSQGTLKRTPYSSPKSNKKQNRKAKQKCRCECKKNISLSSTGKPFYVSKGRKVYCGAKYGNPKSGCQKVCGTKSWFSI